MCACLFVCLLLFWFGFFTYLLGVWCSRMFHTAASLMVGGNQSVPEGFPWPSGGCYQTLTLTSFWSGHMCRTLSSHHYPKHESRAYILNCNLLDCIHVLGVGEFRTVGRSVFTHWCTLQWCFLFNDIYKRTKFFPYNVGLPQQKAVSILGKEKPITCWKPTTTHTAQDQRTSLQVSTLLKRSRGSMNNVSPLHTKMFIHEFITDAIMGDTDVPVLKLVLRSNFLLCCLFIFSMESVGLFGMRLEQPFKSFCSPWYLFSWKSGPLGRRPSYKWSRLDLVWKLMSCFVCLPCLLTSSWRPCWCWVSTTGNWEMVVQFPRPAAFLPIIMLTVVS